jgi:hypothetical protein
MLLDERLSRAQLEPCGSPGLGGRHPAADEIAGQHLEMRPQLVVQIAIERRGPEPRVDACGEAKQRRACASNRASAGPIVLVVDHGASPV